MADSDSQADPLAELVEEFLARVQSGDRPSLEEYLERYPHLGDGLRAALPALLALDKARPPSGEHTGEYEPEVGGPRLERLGDFRILREIGRGGMGIVYEAEQESLGRHVALKILPSHQLLDRQRLQRFQREARSAARLHHTNIVPVFGVGQHDGLHYYVMQFIHGQALDQVLAELVKLRALKSTASPAAGPPGPGEGKGSASEVQVVAHSLWTSHFTRPSGDSDEIATAEPRGRKLPACEPGGQAGSLSPQGHEPSSLSESGRPYWNSVARIGLQAADALAYAHSQGILHRDIKPSNLLLDTAGIVWITDFGLAKGSDSEELTHSGDIVGTLRYMAPERFHGRGDARSDLYSLGLTLYELLTFRRAFDQRDRQHLIQQVTTEEPPPPRRLNPAVPRDLETIVLKAISRDPGHRYASAGELAGDLRRYLDDRPIQARRVSATERFVRWCRRNPLVAGLGGLIFLLLLGMVGVAAYAAWQSGQNAQRERDLAKKALESQKDAEKAQQDAESLLGQQYVHNGVRHLEQGDKAGAALWFAEALTRDNQDPDRVKMHRLRLGGVLADCLRPRQVWHLPEGIVAGQYAPDGSIVALAARDGRIRIYDAATGKLLLTFGPLTAPPDTLLFSKDGHRLLTWSSLIDQANVRTRFQFWDVDTGHCLVDSDQFSIPGTTPPSLSFPDEKYLVAHRDGKIRVWDSRDGKPVGKQVACPDVYSCQFCEDGLFWAATLKPPSKAGSSQGLTELQEIRSWEIGPWGARQKSAFPVNRPAYTTSASPDGRHWLLSGPEAVEVLDTVSGKRLWQRRFGLAFGHQAWLTPDGRRVLVDDGQQQIVILDTESGQKVFPHQLPGLRSFPGVFQVFPHSSQKVVVIDGRRTSAFDLVTGVTKELYAGDIQNLMPTTSPDGRWVVLLTAKQGPLVMDLITGKPAFPWLVHETSVNAALFSPDGRNLLTLTSQCARIWPLDGSSATGPAWPVDSDYAVAHPNKPHVLLVRTNETPLLWDLEKGTTTPLQVPREKNMGILWPGYQFDPTGQWLLARTQDEARLYDAASGKAGPVIPLWTNAQGLPQSPTIAAGIVGLIASSLGQGPLAAAAFLPATTRINPLAAYASFCQEGPYLLVGSGGQQYHVWDVRAGKPLGEPVSLTGKGQLSRFFSSPAGPRLIVTWSNDKGQHSALLDAQTGKELSRLVEASPNFISFSLVNRDGSRFLLQTQAQFTGNDCTLRQWSGSNGSSQWGPQKVFNVQPLGGGFSGMMGMGGFGGIMGGGFNFGGGGFNFAGGAFAGGGFSGMAGMMGMGGGFGGMGGQFSGQFYMMGSAFFTPRSHFSPDDKRLFINSLPPQFLDAETGKPLPCAIHHFAPVTSWDFSRDGKYLATASLDQTARVWDARTGEPVTGPLEHGVSVTGVQFSADSRRLATAGMGDNNRWEVRFWDPATGLPLAGADLLDAAGPTCTPDLRFLFLPGQQLRPQVRELAEDPRPPHELRRLAQVLSGRRLNDTGAIMPLEPGRLVQWLREQPPPGPAGDAVPWHRRQAELCMMPSLAGAQAWFPSYAMFPSYAIPQAAIWHLDRVLARDPKDLQALVLRGEAFLAVGRWEQAAADFTRARERPGLNEPSLNDIHYKRGVALWQLGKKTAAAQDWEQYGPSPALALARLDQGDVPAYQKACRAMASQAAAVNLISLVSLAGPANTEWKAQIRQWPKAWGLDHNPGMDGLAGLIHYRCGETKRAHARLSKATAQANSGTTLDYLFLAMACHDLSKTGEAENAWKIGAGKYLEEKARRLDVAPLTILQSWERDLIDDLVYREAARALGKEPPE
jgi:serine/threonine protein kinase/WD40 repeat protein/tetratricopeptide (TPR) repeat protein